MSLVAPSHAAGGGFRRSTSSATSAGSCSRHDDHRHFYGSVSVSGVLGRRLLGLGLRRSYQRPAFASTAFWEKMAPVSQASTVTDVICARHFSNALANVSGCGCVSRATGRAARRREASRPLVFVSGGGLCSAWRSCCSQLSAVFVTDAIAWRVAMLIGIFSACRALLPAALREHNGLIIHTNRPGDFEPLRRHSMPASPAYAVAARRHLHVTGLTGCALAFQNTKALHGAVMIMAQSSSALWTIGVLWACCQGRVTTAQKRRQHHSAGHQQTLPPGLVWLS